MKILLLLPNKTKMADNIEVEVEQTTNNRQLALLYHRHFGSQNNRL